MATLSAETAKSGGGSSYSTPSGIGSQTIRESTAAECVCVRIPRILEWKASRFAQTARGRVDSLYRALDLGLVSAARRKAV